MYEISEFEVDLEGAPGGDRSRALALAASVEAQFPDGSRPIWFVVDRDLSLALGADFGGTYIGSYDGPSLMSLLR